MIQHDSRCCNLSYRYLHRGHPQNALRRIASVWTGYTKSNSQNNFRKRNGILLNFVKDRTLPIFVYTDFNDIVRWGNGTQKAISKRAKDFLTYLKKRRNEQEISFQLQIPDAMKQIMMTILQGQTEEQVTLRNPFKKKTVEMETTEVKKPAPEFCVIVNNANGDFICNLNQNDFCGVLKDAVFLANWYESESRNKNSMFYRCVVERKGMLDTVNKYMKGIK